MAQVDLEVRQNAHQPLRDLGPMAYEVLHAVASRLVRDGRLRGPLPSTFTVPSEHDLQTLRPQLRERPPLVSLSVAA
jgi:hypothetical protein